MSEPLFASPAGGIVRIALPVPIDSLFDYRVPGPLYDSVRPGCRVLVPFSGRKLPGIVVERARGSLEAAAPEHNDPTGTSLESAPALSPTSLAWIDQLIDDEPVMAEPFMRLLMEAADEVLCPPGLALAAALPAGSAPRTVPCFELLPRGREALRTGAARSRARDLLEALAAGPVEAAVLGRRIETASALLEALSRDGLVRRVDSLRAPTARVARERIAVPMADLDLEAVCAAALARAPKQAALLRRLVELGELPTRDLAGRADAKPETLRNLVARGFVHVIEREAPRNVLGPAVERDERLPLTPEQAAALVPIGASIRSRQAATYLLHGVTGSGKTEVYLRAIAEALAAGRQALVLVPEITLTHQIVARLRARFGDALAVLHSGLRPGERLEQWQRLRRGDTPIAVGARSALFAPLEDIGVIVIDEEHDSAYKNDEGFRYHARRLAERRAELAGCPLILGTATPALETRYRAETGEIERLVLERRIGGRPLPAVEIVDLAEERRRTPRGRKHILARPLRRAIRETLDAGGQSILFLNRRGFSTRIFCFDCGHAEHCGSCDVSLVYHAGEHLLR